MIADSSPFPVLALALIGLGAHGVRGGRIRFVAVATRAASNNRAVLRRYLAVAKLG